MLFSQEGEAGSGVKTKRRVGRPKRQVVAETSIGEDDVSVLQSVCMLFCLMLEICWCRH